MQAMGKYLRIALAQLFVSLLLMLVSCSTEQGLMNPMNPMIAKPTQPFVYAPAVARSSRYRCWLDGQEHTVLDSLKAQIVRAAGDSRVAVTIECREPVRSVTVRPLALGIKPKHEGGKITFAMERHGSISVEINDDLDTPLLLFWDAPIQTPQPDADTTIFKAGVIHELGELAVGSGKRVFFEGGAVVRGQLKIEGATDVHVWGPGILDQTTRKEPKNTILVRHSSNVVLEDVLLLDTHGWSLHLNYSESIKINRVRIIGWRGNSDGIDVVSSSHVLVHDCFLKTLDDCIAIKAGNWTADDDTIMEDITVRNSVLWNDVPGNALEVGFEMTNQLVRGVHFQNCDVIHVLKGAAFSIHNSGCSRVEDVSFEDIRVEDVRDEFADLYIGLSIYSKDCPKEFFRLNEARRPVPAERQDDISPDNQGQWVLPLNEEERRKFASKRGSISGVRFLRISFNESPRRIVLKGYDADHAISDVSFSDISCKGEALTSWPEDLLRTAHATNVTFAGRAVGSTTKRAHSLPSKN